MSDHTVVLSHIKNYDPEEPLLNRIMNGIMNRIINRIINGIIIRNYPAFPVEASVLSMRPAARPRYFSALSRHLAVRDGLCAPSLFSTNTKSQ